MTGKCARLAVMGGIGLAGLVAGTAQAGDPAAAEAVFREARTELKNGHIAAACDKFAESQRLDPSSGTLLNLADCHVRQGKTATAWAEFLSAARLAHSQQNTTRESEAERRAAELQPGLSHLVVEVPQGVVGLTVVRDGQSVDASTYGSKIPVDPGEHSVRASAPGYVDWSTKVVVDPGGDLEKVFVPQLEKAQASPAASVPAIGAISPSASSSVPSQPPPAAATASSVAPAPIVSIPESGKGATTAYVVGGLGLAALAVGGVFGSLALSRYHDADKLCPTHQNCSAGAMDKRDSADSKATISNIGLGVGLVGVGAGLYLLLTGSGREKEPAPKVSVVPQAGMGGAGATLTGRF